MGDFSQGTFLPCGLFLDSGDTCLRCFYSAIVGKNLTLSKSIHMWDLGFGTVLGMSVLGFGGLEGPEGGLHADAV